jgi:Protein of unknown function (DUF3396)
MNTAEINLNENDESLLTQLAIKDRKGRTMLTVGLMASFYFEEPWTRSKREIIAELAEEYVCRFGAHLRHTEDMRDATIYPLESKRVPSPKQWLPVHADGEAWYFGLHSGKSPSEAGQYTVQGYGGGAIKKSVGVFHISTPLNAFADQKAGFREYVVHISERLKPLSGYGGIGVIQSLDIAAGEPFSSFERVMGERFPGLEIESRLAHVIHLNQGIKGVNWLTVLGDRWIQEMGGLDYLRLWVTEACTLYPYPGGVVIQAGARPELGDVQANRWPTHYANLARALKKIRVKDHYPFHFGGANRFDHEATMKWINRFDDR